MEIGLPAFGSQAEWERRALLGRKSISEEREGEAGVREANPFFMKSSTYSLMIRRHLRKKSLDIYLGVKGATNGRSRSLPCSRTIHCMQKSACAKKKERRQCLRPLDKSRCGGSANRPVRSEGALRWVAPREEAL